MLKFFRLPFATTGDKTAVPDAVDSNGNVSYSQGYGFDYQRQKTDPAAKNIERDKMNQIFFDMTTAIAEIQSQGIPDFITSALNGGTAYSYGQNAIVKYSGGLYISLVAANTALPSDTSKWALLPTPALLQQAAYMSAVAGGTANALTAAFTPAIASLPAAPGTLSLMVRAGAANTTTTPTFSPDGLPAKTIVKGNNLALVAGDIAGAGHWLEMNFDATLDKWVLLNPYGAGGIPTAVAGGTADAITADFAPNIALTNGTAVIVRAGAANTTTPTFSPGGLPAKTIVKGNNLALVAGDIAGAGHWLEMSFDTVLDKWVLLNPYGAGIQIASTAEAQAYASDSVALTPLKMRQAMQGSNVSFANNGYQKLPSGLIIQWGLYTTAGTTNSAAISYPIAFPNNVLNVVATHESSVSGSVYAVATNTQTASGFKLIASGGSGGTYVRWIALGY